MCTVENNGCDLHLIIPQGSISCRFTSFFSLHITFTVSESSVLGSTSSISHLHKSLCIANDSKSLRVF